MKNNKIVFILMFCILLNLTSCSNQENNDLNQTTQKKLEEDNYTKITTWSYDFKNTVSNNKQIEIDKKLAIDERCIWCGKCVRISPENFAMNFQTFKAEVISQQNIDSQWVNRSIAICPTNSISIN